MVCFFMNVYINQQERNKFSICRKMADYSIKQGYKNNESTKTYQTISYYTQTLVSILGNATSILLTFQTFRIYTIAKIIPNI